MKPILCIHVSLLTLYHPPTNRAERNEMYFFKPTLARMDSLLGSAWTVRQAYRYIHIIIPSCCLPTAHGGNGGSVQPY